MQMNTKRKFKKSRLSFVAAISGILFAQSACVSDRDTSIKPSAPTSPASAFQSKTLSGVLGSGLDAQARKKALEAEYRALETGLTGAAVKWQAETGSSGSVTPGPRYQIGERFCRHYVHLVFYPEGNQHAPENASKRAPKRASGTACRDEAGNWTALE